MKIIKPAALTRHVSESRFQFSEATIDFGIVPCVIGVKRLIPVVFGTYLYEGIMPIQHVENNVYVCTVDCWRKVLIGERYEKVQDESLEDRC